MPWQARSTRRAQLPADWDTRRAHILDRDGHACTAYTHGVRCGRPANQVHHIRSPFDHSATNLTSLCADHHKVETTAEGHAAMRALRTKAKHPTQHHPGRTNRT